METLTIEKCKNTKKSKPTFTCAFEGNIVLSNWYKRFKQYLIAKKYEFKDIDVDNLLFQTKEHEIPTNKIISIKMGDENEKYYLLLEMKNASNVEYQRYQYYSQYLLELRESYSVYLDLILVFNTKNQCVLHSENLVLFKDLNVLSTSVDESSFNFKCLASLSNR